jgi:hypothetical protein
VTEYFHFAIDDKVQDLIDKLISVAKNNFEREICELKQKFYQGMADKTSALNHQKLRISAFNDLPWYSKLCRLLTNKRI